MIFRKIVLIVIAFTSFIIAQTSNTIVLKEGLYLKSIDIQRRGMFASDPVEEKIVTGSWKTPVEGDSALYDKNSSKWSKISVDKEGWFGDEKMRGGYICVVYDSPQKQKVLLEGFGHSLVYVNGQLHFGNRYGTKEKFEIWEPRFDISIIPIELKKGKNEFLFAVAGKMKARLTQCGEGVYFNTNDSTLPNLIAGEVYEGLGAVVLINNTDELLKDVSVVTKISNAENVNNSLPVIPIQPMSLRKIPVKIFSPKSATKGNMEMILQVVENTTKKVLTETKINVRVVNKSDNHKVTFTSSIDGSIQYYSVNPARNDDGKPKALFLSIHGAGVEAINQSNSYFPKTWGHIAAATNRRPYGFNWEDWGRIDAMEVYSHALKTLNIDSSRIYLTGHSMGGHGTWHLGALYPDKFAAIGPSAGWISFWSYRMRDKNEYPSPMEKMISRATSPSDTYGLSENYKQEGIYIIHGEKDDNVAPTESRNMVEHLKKFHNDFVYYEQPGAGHWWDNSDEEGADCVDWAPLFDFFAHHAIPKDAMVREISFTTANPEISSRDHWIAVISQLEQLKLSKVNFRFDPGKNRFVGKTENVFQMELDYSIADIKRNTLVEIDGQKLMVEPSGEKRIIRLQNNGGTWILPDKIDLSNKSPNRYGTFKSVINHNVVFIYGTKGNKEENEWSFNKARYDAEQFWYQGNGAIVIIKDTDFTGTGESGPNYVLYGNAQTNTAWNKLLKNSPVQVTRGEAKIGNIEYKGKDIACMFVRPIKGTDDKTVGVISGTGITGMKLTDRRNYMQPAVSYPDLILYNSDILSKGIEGVLASGFFGLDWSVDKGEIVYKSK
jgi:pimeloyl-ACP methyl ester carboxylesterase